MTALLLVPVVLSLLTLAAHFLRAGLLVLVVAVLALLPILAVRRRWVARLVQAVLVLGGIEWVRTLFRLAAERAAVGEPATRMVVILAGVAAVTFLAAGLFESARLRRLYRR